MCSPLRMRGFRLPYLESMFCGRPAVVTRAGGNAELIADCREGFVFARHAPEIVRKTQGAGLAVPRSMAPNGPRRECQGDHGVPNGWAALSA